jgi:hypothetical protein
VAGLIGNATNENEGLMSNSDKIKLNNIPNVYSYRGYIESSNYLKIPVNSDVINKGFVVINMSVNNDTGFGFKKSQYQLTLISGRQYGQTEQAGIGCCYRPQGNTAYVQGIYYEYDSNSILRNLYISFSGRVFTELEVRNASSDISIVAEATGTLKTIGTGWNIAL